MKKLLLFILIPFIGIAQQFTDSGINYNITSATAPFTVEVIANTPIYSGNVSIPLNVDYLSNTYAVTAIGYAAFNGCSGLTSVTIPNSVTTIGSNAFVDCIGLTSVTIPNSVATISDFAFDNSGLTSVTIPNSVTIIKFGVFINCNGLTSVTIPNSVIIIENNAFDNSGLTSLTIPDSVTFIGDGAFQNCTGLTTVNCYIETPLMFSGRNTVFQGVNQGACALNVPVGSETAYGAATIWRDFAPINGVLATSSFVKSSFSMYPNPSNGFVTIALKNNLQVEKVNFYNSLGQLVKTATTNIVSTSEFAKGSYFVEVVTNEGKATKQLLVQ